MSQYFQNDPTLKDKKYTIKCTFNDIKFEFNSNNGVFCKKSLDYGTNLLIESVINLNRDGLNLDLGCGIGFIGIILAYFDKNKYILSDVNFKALELSKENIDKLHLNKRVIVKESDNFTNIKENFNNIYLNPPIRAGKKVIYSMYEQSYLHLNENGNLYIVIRIKQGALSTYKYLQNLFGVDNVSIINKKKGYQIIKANKKEKH